MATPIYNDNMCGQMKTMLDRVFEREHEVKSKEEFLFHHDCRRFQHGVRPAGDSAISSATCPAPKKKGLLRERASA
ncbi:MAG: hypothetical protein ACLR8Y_10835 [Alistipes indistinctus]